MGRLYLLVPEGNDEKFREIFRQAFPVSSGVGIRIYHSLASVLGILSNQSFNDHDAFVVVRGVAITPQDDIVAEGSEIEPSLAAATQCGAVAVSCDQTNLLSTFEGVARELRKRSHQTKHQTLKLPR